MRSVTLTTRTRRAGTNLRRRAAAAMTSKVTSTPIPTKTLMKKESKQVSGGFPIVDLHIRVFAVVHAGEFPNGSTGYTMLLAN